MAFFNIFRSKRNKRAVSQDKRRRKDDVLEYDDNAAADQPLNMYQKKLVTDTIMNSDFNAIAELMKINIDKDAMLDEGETVATFAVKTMADRYADVLENIKKFQQEHWEAFAVMDRISQYDNVEQQRAAAFLLSETALQQLVDIPAEDYPQQLLRQNSLSNMILDEDLQASIERYKHAVAVAGAAIGVTDTFDYSDGLLDAEPNKHGEDPYDLYSELHDKVTQGSALDMMQERFNQIEILRQNFAVPPSQKEVQEWANDPLLQHDFPMIIPYATIKHSPEARQAAKAEQEINRAMQNEQQNARIFVVSQNGVTVEDDASDNLLDELDDITPKVGDYKGITFNMDDSYYPDISEQPEMPVAVESHDENALHDYAVIPDDQAEEIINIIGYQDITQANMLRTLDPNALLGDGGDTVVTTAAKIYSIYASGYMKMYETVIPEYTDAMRLVNDIGAETNPDHQKAMITFTSAEILDALGVPPEERPATVIPHDMIQDMQEVKNAQNSMLRARNIIGDIVQADGIPDMMEKMQQTVMDMNGLHATDIHDAAFNDVAKMEKEHGIVFDEQLEISFEQIEQQQNAILEAENMADIEADLDRWANDPVLRERFPFLAQFAPSPAMAPVVETAAQIDAKQKPSFVLELPSDDHEAQEVYDVEIGVKQEKPEKPSIHFEAPAATNNDDAPVDIVVSAFDDTPVVRPSVVDDKRMVEPFLFEPPPVKPAPVKDTYGYDDAQPSNEFFENKKSVTSTTHTTYTYHYVQTQKPAK